MEGELVIIFRHSNMNIAYMTNDFGVSMKCCAKCRRAKDISEFYASKRYKDGRRTACKSCEKGRANQWRAANSERVRLAKREWDEKNKAHVLEYRKKYVQENLSEIRAKARAAAAIYRDKNIDVVRARNIEYKRANIEKNRANAREWARSNPEKNRARARIWAEQNNARVIARVRAYAKKHPEIAITSRRRRRVSLAHANVEWANSFFISEIYDLARRRTQVTGIKWEVDHIVPIRSRLVCGLHVHWNLAVIPAKINRKKSNVSWPGKP